MPHRATLFRSNRSQAVRLPKDVAFPENVKQVAVWREGKKLILAPTESVWDDFFARPGLDDFPERDQPAPQERDLF